MIKQDIIKLGELLSNGIKEFRATGGRLVCNSFGNGNDQCCAITATTRAGTKLEVLSNLLGTKIFHAEMMCIAFGFDFVRYEDTLQAYPCEGASDLWQLGQDLRMKYLPVMR